MGSWARRAGALAPRRKTRDSLRPWRNCCGRTPGGGRGDVYVINSHFPHFVSPIHRTRVPSPLVGEGQGEGVYGSSTTATGPHPDPLPHGGRGRRRVLAMTLLFNRLVIAGVGLIGGSLGLAARARGLVGEVIGFGRTEANLQVALERGILDAYTFDPAEAARGADLLLLAVPWEAAGPGARAIVPFLSAGRVITDSGGGEQPDVVALGPLLAPTPP